MNPAAYADLLANLRMRTNRNIIAASAITSTHQ
jgi:hypothetical protein